MSAVEMPENKESGPVSASSKLFFVVWIKLKPARVGERRVRNAEVESSILFGSTRKPQDEDPAAFFILCPRAAGSDRRGAEKQKKAPRKGGLLRRAFNTF
ncbi:MAG: hypothetical protein VB021_02480 [Oscillospiraceae bacterium]|nr:hypothetical protein [Oscillospiraceae bacterium]